MATMRGDAKNKMKNFSGISSTLYAAKQLFQGTPSQPFKEAHAIQTFLSPFQRILRSALKKLLTAVSIRKYRVLHDEILDKISFLSNLMTEVAETQDCEGNTTKHRIQSHLLLLQNNNKFFIPFRDACLTRSVKILVVALDGLQVLLSCGFFSSYSDYQYAIDINCMEKKNDTEFTHKCQSGVMEDVLELIINLSELSDDSVQLKVLRCFLTMLTATCCTRLQGDTLLRAIQGVFTLYSNIKSDQNQRTAEAALTQIINTLMFNTKKTKVGLAENYLNNFSFVSHDFPHLGRESDAKYSVSEDAMMNSDWIVSSSNIKGKEILLLREKRQLQRRKTFCCRFIDSSKKNANKRFHSEPHRPSRFHTLPASVIDNSLHKKLNSSETLSLPCSVFEMGDCDFFKNNNEMAQTSIQDQTSILCYLCSLTTKEESGDFGDDYLSFKVKKLALELLLSLIQSECVLYKNTPAIMNFIQHVLFLSIVRNSLSPIAKIFEVSLSLFVTLFTHFKDQLNFEILIFVQYILLYFLESEFCSFEHKQKVLQVLHTLMKDFRFSVEVYVNFDCNVKKPFLLSRIVEHLSSLAHINASVDSYVASFTQTQQNILSQLSLETLTIFLESLFEWVAKCFKQKQIDCHFFQNINTIQDMEKGKKNLSVFCSPSEPMNDALSSFKSLVETQNPCVRHYDQCVETSLLQDCSLCTNERFVMIRQNRERKKQLRKLIDVFNSNPTKGVDLLVENNFVKRNSLHVALFFLHITGLSKESIGNYLGGDKPFNLDVLHAFVNQLQFQGMEIDTALRKFLSLFRLPGEAQKIDRMMESFAAKYVQENPDKFENADCAYVLAFSLVMLHTDAHARSIRPENKMTVDMFIKNNRGINNNSDLPAEYLAFLYHRVVEEEWTLENTTATNTQFSEIKNNSPQAIPGFSMFSLQDSQQLFISGVATALGFSNGKKKSGIFRKQTKFLTDVVLGYLSHVSQDQLHSDTCLRKSSKNNQEKINQDISQTSFCDTDELTLQLFKDTINDFVHVDDDLVCLVQCLFQSISSFLHKAFSRTWQRTQENKSLGITVFFSNTTQSKED
ncbi:brefeldin A-inhibited guanine nucleotide-exchange protein 2-like [Hylaeus volcanicus]|uniref:brefeldin A-inhibited guanine nucleotide-exchange protein 2-like n=1 Tax=Hylaeus volcanicus TaxID=313075 RepID=UPI0023B83993|nr:brefeldin A-inhibited guanine nucleotide-exchange protein 2-like [Hylaeus volcanicus]